MGGRDEEDLNYKLLSFLYRIQEKEHRKVGGKQGKKGTGIHEDITCNVWR